MRDMRRLPFNVVTALGLLVGHALALGQYDALGFVSEDIAPGFWERGFAVAEEPSLAKRDGSCGSGQHPCSDVNSTLCCPNEQYCIVNSNWTVQCCALGSTCNSKCDLTHYYANTTETVSTTLAVTIDSATQTLTSTETTTTVTTSSVCSPRSCTSTQYLCASSFGGGCCPFGYDCATSSCIGTVSSSSSSSSVSPLVTPVPSGCSLQGQTLCTAGAGISGSGCCDSGYACITYSSSLMCSETPTSSSATGTGTGTAPGNVTVEHDTSHAISTGAKAGIAIGVIVAAALVVGGLTWLCIRRRRREGRSTTTGNEMRSVPPNDNNTPGAIRGVTSNGRPHGPGRNMSDPSGYAPSSTQVSRDYFGSGPYSDRHPSIVPHHNNDVDDEGAANNTWESNVATAGTPLHHESAYYARNYQDNPPQHQHQREIPHGPDDVLAPVEIGSGGGPNMARGQGTSDVDISSINNRGRGYSQAGSEGGSHSELADTSSGAMPRSGPGGRNPSYGQGGVRDSIAGRFELYGGDTGGGAAAAGGGSGGTNLPQPFPTPGSEMSELGTPSPMSREEEQHPRREV